MSTDKSCAINCMGKATPAGNAKDQEGMGTGTDNYADPTEAMLADPLWNAIWNEIKTWDINVPHHYAGYSGATGNHVTAIYTAVMKAQMKLLQDVMGKLPGILAARGMK